MPGICVSSQDGDRGVGVVARGLREAKPLHHSMWCGSLVARLQSLTSFESSSSSSSHHLSRSVSLASALCPPSIFSFGFTSIKSLNLWLIHIRPEGCHVSFLTRHCYFNEWERRSVSRIWGCAFSPNLSRVLQCLIHQFTLSTKPNVFFI